MTRQPSLAIQDPYLNALRREKVSVAIYLVNGIKLQGIVEGFDQFIILLRSNTQQLIYKHAVSTIKPLKNFKYNSHSDKMFLEENDTKTESGQIPSDLGPY